MHPSSILLEACVSSHDPSRSSISETVGAQNRLAVLISALHLLHLSKPSKLTHFYIWKVRIIKRGFRCFCLEGVLIIWSSQMGNCCPSNFMPIFFKDAFVPVSQKIKFAHYWISDGRKMRHLGSDFLQYLS